MSSNDEQSSSDAAPRVAPPSIRTQSPSTNGRAGSPSSSGAPRIGGNPSTSPPSGSHRSTPPSSDGAPTRQRPPTRSASSSQSRPSTRSAPATKQAPGKRANRDGPRTRTVSKSAPPKPAPVSRKPPVEDKPRRSSADRARAAAGVLGEGTDKIRNLIASIVWLLAVVGSVILALGALLYALDAANRANEIVDFFISTGERLVGPFDTVFKFGRNEDGKEHLVNWGLAAVVYLIVGKVLDRIIRPSR